MASSSATQQSPTCVDTFVRSVADVHKIFYAVLLGRMPLIARRLDAAERDALVTGCCYVWEDRGPHSVTGLGIERFTEGRHWSASRVRDDFLFYYEKFKGGSAAGNANASNSDDRPPRDWEPLVKQTYSVFVNPNPGEPEPNPPKKWHLTAYYTESSIDTLRAVDSLPEVQGLTIPEGMFRCSRSVKPRSRAGKAKAAREKTGGNEDKGAREAKTDTSEEKEKKARGAKRTQPRVNAVAGPSRVKHEPASPSEETLIAPAPASASTSSSAPRPAGTNMSIPSSSSANVSRAPMGHFDGSNIAISNVNSTHQQPRTVQSHLASSQSNQNSAKTTAPASASAPRQYGQVIATAAHELPYAQESQYTPSPTSTSFTAFPTPHQLNISSAHTSYARSSSATSPYGYNATDRPPSSAYSLTSPVSPTSPGGFPAFAATPTSPVYASGTSEHALSSTSPVAYYPGRPSPETSHAFRSGSAPLQQTFRPTSSLAGALDPDAISTSSRRGSLASFAAAAQRLGSYGTSSPSPPTGVGMGSGSGSMLPPPLPPLGTSVPGMHVAHPADMSGDVAMSAGASSSLNTAMNAPDMRTPLGSSSMPINADPSAVPMNVDMVLQPRPQEHVEAGFGHAGADFSVPPYSGVGAGYTTSVRAGTSASFSAGAPRFGMADDIGADWAEQQQQQQHQQQQQSFTDTFDLGTAVAVGQPTFFTVPPQSQSPFAHPVAGYALQSPAYPYAGASPAPSALSISSGSSGGIRPGTGYSNGRPGTGYSSTGYAPGTPLQPGAPFQPGAPLPPGPKSRAEGHIVGYSNAQSTGAPFDIAHPPFSPHGPRAPASDLIGVTGWAGERRTSLADHASLRRFKPYAKPRDPVDEATVRALGVAIGGSSGEKDG